MSTIPNLTWQTSDVQFLEALLLATGGEGGAPLQEVLLMYDALDGIVLPLQEVESSLLKLIAAGIISIQKNKLALTPKFMKLYEALSQQANEEEESKALLQLLLQQEVSEEQLNTVRQQELKKYKLKNHYQQYLEQFG